MAKFFWLKVCYIFYFQSMPPIISITPRLSVCLYVCLCVPQGNVYIYSFVCTFIYFDIKTEKSLTIVCCHFKSNEKITLMHTVLTCKLFRLVLLKWSKLIIQGNCLNTWYGCLFFLILFFPSLKIKFWNLLTGNKWVSAEIKKIPTWAIFANVTHIGICQIQCSHFVLWNWLIRRQWI